MRIDDLIVEEVMNKILDAGHEVYLVGGYVRDLLLGKCNHDVDLATSMPSQEVFELFIYFSDIQHYPRYGAVHFSIPPYSFEITQFRQEADYVQNRYPKTLRFVERKSQDARRRDLSINALYLDSEGNLYDPYGGLADLENQCLRMIHPVEEKFEEDHLRTVRLLRMHAQLGFDIEARTEKAMILRPQLTWAMKQDEMKKILEADHFDRSLLFYQSYYENIFELESFDLKIFSLPAYWPYRFLTLYRHDLEKMEAILLSWHLPQMERKHLMKIAEACLYFEKDAYEEAWYLFDELIFFDALNYWTMVSKDVAKNPQIQTILASPYRYVSDLAIDGHDLKAWSIPNAQRHRCLKALLWAVIHRQIDNKKHALKEAARRLKNDLY